tara:strand:- start:2237 stop:5182 length:2946 start_codon:yes stop_codon:yes gene_type:complete
MKNLFLIGIVFFSFLKATGTWMWNNRTHGELKWKTITTKNFNIHYHQGLRKIAIKGARIAEQSRPILIQQMGLDSLPKLDIVFTSEDEVLNGFALPANYTIIWVDQNDAALWTGDEKWLRTVLAHELQHLVYFNTVKGPWWLPEPMNTILNGTPSWVVEGIAEYYTEKWRPWRYEISHRGHVIRNTVHKIQDPHNDGFSKSLYLADRFGDSTITKILNHRNKLQFLNFKKSFKKHTGISVKQFNEDWRRHMNTYYFSQRSQKETLNEAGSVSKLPIKRIVAFDYFSDTMNMALIGQLSKGQNDLSLIIATRDTAKENKIRKIRSSRFEKTGIEPKKVKPKWKIKELDHGRFGEINFNLDVSKDGKTIVYPKYGYGINQSLSYDVWKVDVKSKKKTALTKSMRANYPKFSPDGSKILFVAHKNSTSQLYTINSDGENIKQITSNEGDVQILTPAWSPDGQAIAFAMSGNDGKLDIYVLDVTSGISRQITDSNEADAFPIWHPNSQKISYTGFYDENPNLFTYDFLNNKTIQNTDLWNLYVGMDWNEKLSTVTAMTLGTVDSSRVVDIDPSRVATPSEIKMNPLFSNWKIKKPDFPLVDVDANDEKSLKIVSETKYNPFKQMRHLGTILIPDLEGLLYNGAFTDVLGRHTLGISYYMAYDIISGLYFQYQNSTGFPINGFWGFDFYHNANFQLQFSSRDDIYIEAFNGAAFWTKIPYNFGKSQSSNHMIYGSLQFINRKQIIETEMKQPIIFSDPSEGKEGSINFKYSYINKRNHIKNFYNPNQGFGFEITLKIANSQMWGEFNYEKSELDFFANKKFGPFVLYARTRYEIMNGLPPSQEALGIVDIPNYYLMGSITPGREYMSPRGYEGSPRFGNNAYMGTFELRAPVIPINLVEVIKVLKFGSPTFALISDFGDAWYDDNASVLDTKEETIITLGYEFRMALKISNIPLFIFSYGWAQEKDKWLNNIDPRSYFQMTLINPF